MTHRRLALAPAAALALALVLTSCSGDDDEKEEPLSALTPVERTVQTNPDRDARVVEDKAAAIDPCALVRAGNDAVGGPLAGDPEADGPHSCWTSTSSVRVDSYTPVSELERFEMAQMELAGATAYRADLRRSSCLIHLPISHDRAISFSGVSRCRNITAYAEAAARLLQQRPRQATRPQGLGRVSACALVEEAGRTPHTDWGGTKYTVLDECRVENAPIDLRLEYDDTVVRDYQTAHRVGGTTVRSQDTGDTCYVHVPLAPADVSVREDEVLIARITSSTCKQGLAFARKLVPAAERIVAPRGSPRDLLIPADEPDTSAVGACVDLLDQADLECTPAEQAEVPSDRRDLIMQAEADPDVLCAAAAPVVADHYGDTFTGVTALASPVLAAVSGHGGDTELTQCAFGSPEHTFQVSVLVSTDTARVADTDIDGHPTRIQETESLPYFASKSYVVARDETDEPGLLAVELHAWPERGTGDHDRSRADTAPLDQADEFVADLADALL